MLRDTAASFTITCAVITHACMCCVLAACATISRGLCVSPPCVLFTRQPDTRRTLKHCTCCTAVGPSRCDHLQGFAVAIFQLFVVLLSCWGSAPRIARVCPCFAACRRRITFVWQAALALSTQLVSPKFSKKISYCATLADLQDKLGVALDVPNFVM